MGDNAIDVILSLGRHVSRSLSPMLNLSTRVNHMASFYEPPEMRDTSKKIVLIDRKYHSVKLWITIRSIGVFIISLIFIFRELNEIVDTFIVSYAILFSIASLLTTKNIEISENGISIPSFMFFKKNITWNEVISVKLTDDRKGVLIVLDTDWYKLVDTGMQDISLLLSDENYIIVDPPKLEEDIETFRRFSKISTNTLNERIYRQVNAAWDKRWKRAFADLFTFSAYGIYYSITVVLIIYLFTGTMFKPLLWTLIVVVVVISLISAYGGMIVSVVAIRPNELGAVLYDAEEIISNIRFVVMTKPKLIEIENVEVIKGSNELAQVSNLIQIHPQEISPGVLTHCVAQFSGNLTKSRGAKISFRSGEKQYSIDIYWSN